MVDNIDFNKKDIDNQPFKDEQIYELRFVLERTNVWLDAFKALTTRYETKIQTQSIFWALYV